MFDAATRGKIHGAFNTVLDLLAVPATWKQAKAPRATRNVNIGFTVATAREEAIVQDYGVGTRIITVKAGDLPSLEKNDIFEVNGERYKIDGVQDLYINGTKAFLQGYSAGK